MKATILIILCTTMLLCAEEKLFTNSVQLTASAGLATVGGFLNPMLKVKRDNSLYGVSILGAGKLFDSESIIALQFHYGKAVSSKWTYANAYIGGGYAEGTTRGAFDPDDDSWFSDRYDAIPFQSLILSANAEAGVKIYFIGIGVIAGLEASTLPIAYFGLQTIIDIPF